MIKIAITEDNFFALKAIEEKLMAYDDLTIVHRAENGQEILKLLSVDSAVDLLLMDIEMPVINGVEATQQVKKRYPHIKIVMITIFDDDESIFNAIKAGADSYILKETKAEKVYETIVDTLNGGSVMSPSIALKTLQLLKNNTLVKDELSSGNTDKVTTSLLNEISAEKLLLSDRETEILLYLSKGFSNKRIAEVLFISPFTVKRHIENIYKKLQAQNRIELVEKARKGGIL